MVDRVEVTIMYLTFDKFQSFVISLHNFNEMDCHLSHSLGYMHQVKEKNRFIKRDLRVQNMKIIRKVKARKNMKDSLYILENLKFMKSIAQIIRDDLNREDFTAATENYIKFKSMFFSLTKTKIWNHFNIVEKGLTSSLIDFFKSNFESSFINYFNGCFDYTCPSNEPSSNHDLDLSISYSYVFENDDFSDFRIEFTSDKDSEAQIVSLIANLMKINNFSLNTFQSKLLEFYKENNNRLKKDIVNYIASNRSKMARNSQFLNLCKFYFNIHFNALLLVLGIFKKIVSMIFEEYLCDFNSMNQILSSRFFAIVENLYGVFLVMLSTFMGYLRGFLDEVKDSNVNIAELMNMETLISEIQDKTKSEIYESLFPTQPPQSTDPELFRKLMKNIRFNFNNSEFDQFCHELVDSYLMNFHRQNGYCQRRLVENEDWSEINISFDLREKILSLIPLEREAVTFENTKILIADRTFYVSRSLEFCVGTCDTYLKMSKKHLKHSDLLKNMIVDMFYGYNTRLFEIILKGGCVQFGIIKRIDLDLLVSLLKELDFVLKCTENLFAAKVLEGPARKEKLCLDIASHQESLRMNTQWLIREFFKENFDRLADYNWRDPSFKFLTPSVEACNMIGFANDNLKRLRKYLNTNELYPYFVMIKNEVLMEYLNPLGRFSEISSAIKLAIDAEKEFLLTHFNEIERNLTNSDLNKF